MPKSSPRVLESFKQPGKTTNPYITMLFDALGAACETKSFSWREALTGDYDVFHVHWPEILLYSDRRSRRIGRRAAFWLLLQRIKYRRVAVVRTMHNLKPHETPSQIDTRLLAKLDSITTAWIRLNPVTEPNDSADVTTILLGHYLDWFEEVPDLEPTPGLIGNFGLIRAYKGVPELITAMRSSDNPDMSLVVMGAPASTELADEILQLAGTDPRITLELTHVDDATLAREVRRCSVVALPHHNMHNSSSLLLALSLDRPALVPNTPVTRHIRDEVGSEWVYLYENLDASALEGAVRRAAEEPRGARPDLSQRDWKQVAAAHIAVFERAIKAAQTAD
ncbi:MAG: hypothetical protein WC054_06320 [Candidatus Nanopelagicales bacterium]